ncbi:MAG: hypothetical protein HOJ97_04435 [Alphaproteobacteria bacterium]|nr:hypothetical protein [Alphaproteobacteria bacterium]
MMSLDNSEWHQTNSLQMSVQTADLFLLNENQIEQISLYCTLLTIARGTCNLIIMQHPSVLEGSENLLHKKEQFEKFKGFIKIPIDRPVMQCEGGLPLEQFQSLMKKFVTISPVGRPITLTLTLDKMLSVSVNGDLYIEKTCKVGIKHIDFAFPLR